MIIIGSLKLEPELFDRYNPKRSNTAATFKRFFCFLVRGRY
jgi:hypothetical protein